MKRLIALLATALAAAVAAGPAGAATYLDQTYGTPLLGLSPRSQAMGGTGAALGTGAYGLVDNPATLTMGSANRLQIQGRLLRTSENRFVPLFDTFDSYVVETAIAVNDHLYGSMNGGFTLTGFGPRGLVVAAGVFDRYDPRYDYEDERRSVSSDEIVSNRHISTSGLLRTYTLGAALPVAERFSLGLALNWYDGVYDHRDALVPTNPQSTGPVSELERRLSGTSVTLGATGRIDERLQAGIAFESAPRLDDDYTSWQDGVVTSPPGSKGTLKLPWRFQGGAQYLPQNTLRTTFALDVVFMPWSKAEDHLHPDVDLLDTWDVRFGLEHVYFNDLPARLGFRYQRSPEMREADVATFTFGVGYESNPYHVGFAGEVGKRTSRQEPIWPRDEQGPAVGLGLDRVEDTVVRLSVGATIDF